MQCLQSTTLSNKICVGLLVGLFLLNMLVILIIITLLGVVQFFPKYTLRSQGRVGGARLGVGSHFQANGEMLGANNVIIWK